MPNKTFTSATLTSSDVNTYLSHTGGAWVAWTPSVSQGGAVACTVNIGKYYRAGNLIVAKFRLTVTGTGTGGSAVTISALPTPAVESFETAGTGSIFDSSASSVYSANLFLSSTTLLDFRAHGAPVAAANTQLGVTAFTAALAAGDILDGKIMYEAA